MKVVISGFLVKALSPIQCDKMRYNAIRQENTMSNASLEKLRAAMESASAPGSGEKKSYNDDTMWKPELDKTGNGFAVVRFLPTPEGEEMPWVCLLYTSPSPRDQA